VNPQSSLIDQRRMAQQAYAKGDLPRAGELFLACAQSLQDEGLTAEAAEMANNAAVIFLKLAEPQRALECVQGTPETFLAAGQPGKAGMAFGNLAAALEACGHPEQAEAAYLRAAELLKEHGTHDHYLHTMKALSQLRLKQGKTVEALTAMQAGLEGAKGLSLGHRLLRRLLRLPGRLLGG
jgi:tetratricopeptide (TPR) repeat protein